MAQQKINLSILSIVLFACTIIFILNLADGTLVTNDQNSESSLLNTPPVEPKDNVNKITAINTQKSKIMLEESDRKNGQMVVMHRPDWKFDVQLITQFEKLKSTAENGNIEANYIIAMNLRYCFNSPTDEIAFEKKLEQAYEFSDSSQAVERITEKYQYCSGIEQKQRNQFYTYLKTAANNEYIAAQEAFGEIPSKFFMESQGYENLEREKFITIRDNFIEQKIKFLEQAAQHGSIKALIRLSTMNRSQRFGENGYVNSFAYNQLILALTQSNETYNRYAWLQQKQRSQLTLDEVDAANSISAQWLEIIKTNGTLYLNGN